MDWNEDGKKDLLVGDAGGKITFFKNVGTNSEPVLTQSGSIKAGGKDLELGKAAFQVLDWNNDGRKDLLTGSESNGVSVYLNIGENSVPVFNTGVKLTGNRYIDSNGKRNMLWRANPRAYDMDGDGRKDLVVGNAAYGEIHFFRNTGTDAEPVLSIGKKLSVGLQEMTDESLQQNPLWFDMCDWNGDGGLDIVAGSYKAFITVYLNKSGGNNQ